MLVLLHPIALDGDFWALSKLDGSKPTYPGHGGRAAWPEEQFTLEAIADEIVGNHEGELDIVGVSMGAAVAQYIAARHPTRVRSMMLCCSTLGDAKVESPRSPHEERAQQTLELGMAGVVDSLLARWFSAEAIASGQPGVEYARRRLLSDGPAVVAAAWRILGRRSVRDFLPSIRIPVTVLGGRDDQSATPDRVAELFFALPNARLEIIRGPHMLPLEVPGDFAGAVERHLQWARSHEADRSATAGAGLTARLPW